MPVQPASSEAEAGMSAVCSDRQSKRCRAWQAIVEMRIFLPLVKGADKSGKKLMDLI